MSPALPDGGGDPRSADRARAGTWRAHRRGPRRPRCAARAEAKRSLALRARPPALYLFRDCTSDARATLRARLVLLQNGPAPRPAVEAALAALERIEWRVTGSELEAALEGGATVCCVSFVPSRRPGMPAGPLRLSQAAPRRPGCCSTHERRLRAVAKPGPRATGLPSTGREQRRTNYNNPELALPRLRARLRDLAECRRYEDAAPARPDRSARRRRARLSSASISCAGPVAACLQAEAGFVRAVFVAGGRIAAVRTLPAGAGAGCDIGGARTARDSRARIRVAQQGSICGHLPAPPSAGGPALPPSSATRFSSAVSTCSGGGASDRPLVSFSRPSFISSARWSPSRTSEQALFLPAPGRLDERATRVELRGRPSPDSADRRRGGAVCAASAVRESVPPTGRGSCWVGSGKGLRPRKRPRLSSRDTSPRCGGVSGTTARSCAMNRCVVELLLSRRLMICA